METTLIDFSPLIDDMIGLVFAVLAAGAVWLTNRAISLFERRTGLVVDDRHRANINDGVVRALDHARLKLRQRTAVLPPVEIKNRALGLTADYLMRSYPDAIGHFGLSRERLIDFIEIRLHADLNGDGPLGDRPALPKPRTAGTRSDDNSTASAGSGSH